MARKNGQLPDNELIRIPWDQTERIVEDILDSVVGFGEDFQERFGYLPGITEAYRDIQTQEILFQRFGYPRAAYPGTSNHGWAIAIDWKSGISMYGSMWWFFMNTRGRDYGWRPLNERNRKFEPWHWAVLGTVLVSKPIIHLPPPIKLPPTGELPVSIPEKDWFDMATPVEIENAFATALGRIVEDTTPHAVIFFGDEGTWYEADIPGKCYYELPGGREQAHKRQAVLSVAGVKWRNWVAPEVQDRGAFGRNAGTLPWPND